MTHDADQEREDLEGLLAHPGWTLFRAHVGQEWGPEAYRLKVGQAIGLLPAGGDAPERAATTVLQIEAAAREVERLMDWPRQRVQALERQQAPAVTRAGVDVRWTEGRA